MRRAFVLALLLTPALASADQVVLKGGRKLTGVVVERSPRSVAIEVGPGRVTLPMSQVEAIETGASALATYRARAEGLRQGDANGWLDLAFWARDAGLETQAQDAFARVLAIDPGNASAHAALGHVQLAGRWLSQEESYRAQGLVPFEGSWLSPAEREAMLQERAASASRDLGRIEAEARVREAEARASAAEADARRVEAQRESEYPGGIPYGVVLGGGCSGPGCHRPFWPHPTVPLAQPPQAPPRPPKRPLAH